MDQELKSKWVAALRSGDYKQCRGGWNIDGGYCCVGVLLQIAQGGMGGHRKTADQLGVTDAVGGSNDQLQKLINMNDRHGRSFTEIADYIEANL